MTKWKRLGQTILAILGGVVSYFVSSPMLFPWVNLGWRRPIQDWMIANGVGNFAGHFGLLYIQIPDYITAIIAGVVIGVIGWKRWWQLSLVYSGTVIALPYVSMMIDGPISNILNFRTWTYAFLLLLHFAIIPLVLVSANLTSKSRRRNYMRLKFQLCLHCGYNLTGNESGLCPECGTGFKA